jgi:hypothetical protein
MVSMMMLQHLLNLAGCLLKFKPLEFQRSH